MVSFVQFGCVGIARAFILGTITALLPSVATSESVHHFLGSHEEQVPDLLLELQRVGGHDHFAAAETRVSRLEDVLQPMFASLPKDRRGRLPAAGVRYMLHRLFVQRHAWYVNGLSYDGDAWSSSSPVAVFKDHAEDYRELFQNHLNSQGFSLHEVAVFGATLEVLVHTESTERLQAAYRVLGLAPSEIITETEAKDVIMAYMMLYVKATNHSSLTPAHFDAKIRKRILDHYPTWPATQKFVLEVREALLEDTSADDRTTWSANLKALEEISERYGRWQDSECHDLKHELLLMESSTSGRVRLEDFYRKAATHGDYKFIESVEYLRTLGALDETDPEHLSVIIPNYINSPTNCVASSKFYSVCCINECEELLGTLENNLASPDATPDRIIELISKLPSNTVDAPRILPNVLTRRLEEIASHHGGRVPLHGRLFSQWLHHAYPRECPYPHLAGTTRPMLDNIALKAGIETDATKSEMRSLVKKGRDKKMTRTQNELSVEWNPEEEIFVPIHEQVSSTNFMTVSIRVLVLVALSFAFTSLMLRMFPVEGAKAECYSGQKYCL